MSDHRKAQKCEHQEPYQMISPVNFCSWPYCTCLREGQEMQGLRYEDVKGHDDISRPDGKQHEPQHGAKE